MPWYLVVLSAHGINFDWFDISRAFIMISQYSRRNGGIVPKPEDGVDSERMKMFYVILATAESLRSDPIAHSIRNMFENRSPQDNIFTRRNFNYFTEAINNWRHFVNYLPVQNQQRIPNEDFNFTNLQFINNDLNPLNTALQITLTNNFDNVVRYFYRQDMVSIITHANVANC